MPLKVHVYFEFWELILWLVFGQVCLLQLIRLPSEWSHVVVLQIFIFGSYVHDTFPQRIDFIKFVIFAFRINPEFVGLDPSQEILATNDLGEKNFF